MNTQPSASEFAATVATMFGTMIGAAPDAPDQPPVPTTSPGRVRRSCGWGERYIEPAELRGSEWLATFEKAKLAVASGGIVLFLGSRGTGKTRMAAEIARADKWPADAAEWNGSATTSNRTARYIRAMDLFLDLRDTTRRGSETSEKQILAKLEHCGLLVVDEFQERGGSEWENRVISNLIDKRYSGKRSTILIANFSREEMAAALSDSIKDRIRENGERFDFNWTSYRVKP
jgi:DNA replication protein DnaC